MRTPILCAPAHTSSETDGVRPVTELRNGAWEALGDVALPAESIGRGVDPSTVAIARASMASTAVRVRPISLRLPEAPTRRSTSAFRRPLMTRATLTTSVAIDWQTQPRRGVRATMRSIRSLQAWASPASSPPIVGEV